LGRLEDRFRGTLEVRALYWQASLRGFAENPVTGEGLDSFAETFGRHRDAEDAARFGLSPGNFTDKPHSVPLEWFQSAGFVGGAAFLALIVGGVVVADSARRRLTGPGTPVRRAILAGAVGMLVAYFVQSCFSIDAPPLWLSLWLSLALIATAARGAPVRAAVPVRQLRKTWREIGLAFAALATLLLGVWLVPKPLRADIAFLTAQNALNRDDGSSALIAYGNAFANNPREALYRAALGQSEALRVLQSPQSAAVFVPLAVADYEKAAALEPGNPYHGQRAYQFFDGLAQLGIEPDLNHRRAEEWWQRTIENDPRDPDVLAEGGVLKLHAQDPAGALTRFEEALAIGPASKQVRLAAWKGAGEARFRLNDKRASLAAYNEALQLAPDDSEAQAGLRAAQALPEVP
jgi:tetratricopeptide (TPR) repeat protein